MARKEASGFHVDFTCCQCNGPTLLFLLAVTSKKICLKAYLTFYIQLWEIRLKQMNNFWSNYKIIVLRHYLYAVYQYKVWFV